MVSVDKLVSGSLPQTPYTLFTVASQGTSLNRLIDIFFDGNNLVLYCHCANSGKKLDILSKNPNVFIEIDNEHNIIKGKTPCDYGFEYFSIMSNGKVEFVHDIYDKVHGLNKIMEHYTSNVKNEFKNEILNKVVLLKITCNNLSAKICRG